MIVVGSKVVSRVNPYWRVGVVVAVDDVSKIHTVVFPEAPYAFRNRKLRVHQDLLATEETARSTYKQFLFKMEKY